MKIIHDKITQQGSGPEQELVENEKQEYKLLGRFLRTKGLRLFAYKPIQNELIEVDITIQNSINLIPDETGTNLIPKDIGVEEASINSADIHFEALNLKTANKRVEKYRNGKIKELCNLREASTEGIKFY